MTTASTELPIDLAPMGAETVDKLPTGVGWQYEPKYDGFRCLAHRRSSRVHLRSKNQKPLERYSRHERRKVRVGSISFLILFSASRTIGPQVSISTK